MNVLVLMVNMELHTSTGNRNEGTGRSDTESGKKKVLSRGPKIL